MLVDIITLITDVVGHPPDVLITASDVHHHTKYKTSHSIVELDEIMIKRDYDKEGLCLREIIMQQ